MSSVIERPLQELLWKKTLQTDRLNAIHINTNNIRNVLDCITAYTLIKTDSVLNLIDYIFRVGSLAVLIG